MLNRSVRELSHGMAALGGLVLVGLVMMMTLSITGRALGLGEIKGSYEILEAGIGFAIFAFFPICQFHGAHATVDVFTSALPARINRAIAAVWEIALTATFLFITWRLYDGMQRYIGNGETTFFLQFPVWWSYAVSFAASLVACLTALYCAAARSYESVTGRSILPAD
ncbi:MAG: TRAP transporter small permease [Paracoccaceae bacterium]